ncbi:MAG: histidine triad nucleotide-binding protein [Sulfurimonas sp.]|nr:MAG: histidine triad nucleotide-binding protein [Sulfurimonas sp.]
MCLFCKIVNKEIPSNLVLEDEDFIAFHDINPIAPVHVLAIPKAHIGSFNDIQADTMAKITIFIQNIAKKLNISKSGYRIITNIGNEGGQEVKHIHFHILGGAQLHWPKLT